MSQATHRTGQLAFALVDCVGGSFTMSWLVFLHLRNAGSFDRAGEQTGDPPKQVMWRGSGWRLGRCLLSGPRILSGPQSGCGWTGTLGFTCHRPAPANHIRPFPQHRGLIRAPSSLRLGPLVGPGTSRLERRAERGRTVVRANSAARDPPRSIARQTSRRRGPRGVRPRPGRREVRDGTKGGAPRGKKPRASGKLVYDDDGLRGRASFKLKHSDRPPYLRLLP
ncbi:hypothetical protein BHE74_00059278 [Ensete ventricosum]|nr:hypothetical protein BHE74_00059278 [Ensete ventricosum]